MSESTQDSNVVLIRLIGGEEIMAIADPANQDSAYILVKKPVILHFGYDERTGVVNKIHFAPFMPYTQNQELMLNPSNISVTAVPEAEMEDKYLRAVGERQIITPNEKSIVLPK